jgi:Fe-S-cluster-containing dehydrogenase component
MDRRGFMKVIAGASGAAAAGSCGADRGTEYLIPYLVPPEEEIIPGEAIYYNTTCTECPAGCGLSVKVRDGSAVKLEGVAGHPINDGALCVRGQASLTRLYHPNRVKGPQARGPKGDFQGVTWDEAGARIAGALQEAHRAGRESLYLSSQRTGASSDVIDLFCRMTNVSRLPEFELYSHSAIREANVSLFGRKEVPYYKLDGSDFLLTVGADILETFVSPVSHAVGLRRAKETGRFRWIHAEPHLSLTGLQADERLVIHPGSEAFLLLYLLQRLSSDDRYRGRVPAAAFERIQSISSDEAPLRTGLGRDGLALLNEGLLRAERPLVIVGGVSTGHPLGFETALLGALLQWVSGAIDSSVFFAGTEATGRMGSMKDLDALIGSLKAGGAGVLFLSGVDPLPLSPGPDGLKEGLSRVDLKVALTSFLTPTARECDIVLPLSHSLESWGDAEPIMGLHSIIQPAVEPLYDTMTEGDILLGLTRLTSTIKRRRLFQTYVLDSLGGSRPRAYTETLLARGYAGSPRLSSDTKLDGPMAAGLLDGLKLEPEVARPLVVLAPSIRSFDGRSADLPLMQEIPDPVTTISYGKWLSISRSEAARLGLKDGDEITTSSSEFSLTLPVKALRGLPEGIYCAYRDAAGPLPARFDPRTGEPYCYLEGSSVSRTGESIKLPVMSGSMSQHGRGIIPTPNHREGAGRRGHGRRASMYPSVEHEGHRWAMAVDLDLCIGCAACVAACYIENNVPVVGLVEHLKGREMSWLRVEPFYAEDLARAGHRGGPTRASLGSIAGSEPYGAAASGDASRSGGRMVSFIPMLCQQCTCAPCESVCPVYATYHNPEGLNAQIYNRCVGTRYCSNNCPYKVRRFNWFTHKRPSPGDRMLNPDIFVRGKGVMEKCTFCVQRIRYAKDRAKDESRTVLDGDVTPACAQTCPLGAIVFGDMMDESSRVYRLAHSDRAYSVFEVLGTEPAVYYLRRRAPDERV